MHEKQDWSTQKVTFIFSKFKINTGQPNMIDSFNRSDIAQRYFEKKGEKLTRQEAANKIRKTDVDVDLLIDAAYDAADDFARHYGRKPRTRTTSRKASR